MQAIKLLPSKAAGALRRAATLLEDRKRALGDGFTTSKVLQLGIHALLEPIGTHVHPREAPPPTDGLSR